jgi:hypothetical protein
MPSFGRQLAGPVAGQSVGPVVGLVTRGYGAADFPRCPDAHLVQRLAATLPLTRTSLASAFMRAAGAADKHGFNTTFNVTSSTYTSSSSIVRGAIVGTPLTAKSLASLEGAYTKSLAAFLGVVFLTFRSLGNRWVRLAGSSRAGTAPPTSHGSPDVRLVGRLAVTWLLMRTLLASALACARPPRSRLHP